MDLLSFRDHDFYYSILWEELTLLTFVHLFWTLVGTLSTIFNE